MLKFQLTSLWVEQVIRSLYSVSLQLVVEVVLIQSRSNLAQIQVITLRILQLTEDVLSSLLQRALIQSDIIVLRIRSNNWNLIETILRSSTCITECQYLVCFLDITKLKALSRLTLAINQLYLNQRRIQLCWVQRNIEVTSITALTKNLTRLNIPILVTSINAIERRSQVQL